MSAREILVWFRRQFSLRNLRWWQWLLLLGVGVWVVVRSWLPGFIRQQVVTNLTAITTAQVALGDVDLNLLRGRLALQQLSFTLTGEERPVLVIRDLAVNLRLRSLLRRVINIEDLTLTGAHLEAVQEPDGQLNLAQLFPPSPPEQAQTEPTDLPTLTIQEFQIVDSLITYRDRTRQAEPHFTLHIDNFTTNAITLESHGFATPVTTRLRGTLDQSPLLSDAEILWQREQTTVEMNLETHSLPLTRLELYLQEALAFHKLVGQLETAFHYSYHDGNKSPPVHTLKGTMAIENLQVADPLSQQTALTLPHAHIEIETIDLIQQDVRVTSAELRDLTVVALQTPTGMNLASLVRPAAQDQTTSSSPWRFALQSVKWTGGELRYRDSTWPEAETLVLSPEELEIKHFGSEATEHPFRFRTHVGDGTLAGDGTVQFSPLVLRGQFQPVGVEVATLHPLLTTILPGKTLQGKVTGTIQTVLAQQDSARTLHVAGTVETTKFVVGGLPESGSSVEWESGRITIAEGSTATPLALQLQPQLSRLIVHRPSQAELSVENVTGTVALTQTMVPLGQQQLTLSGPVEATQLTFGPLSVEGIKGNVTLTQITTAEGQQPLTLSGKVETTQLKLNGVPEPANVLAWESGQIDIQDGSTVTPLALEVNTQLANLSLQHLPQGDVAIEKATTTLRLAQEESPQQEQFIRAQGPVEVTGFVLTHGPEKKILLACYHATAKIAESSRVLPLDLYLRDVALEYTYAQGVRTPPGQFQLFIPPAQTPDVASVPSSTVSVSDSVTPTNALTAEAIPETQTTVAPESSTITSSEAQTTGGIAIRIDRLSMIGGELYFEDRTVTPTQTVYWQDVRVELHTVSYSLVLPAAFSVHAYNEDGAPVEFKGMTERQGNQTVVRVRGQVQKVSLARFNSYLEPSLGYRVNKGTVTATWDLVIPGDDRLRANMKVTLHNINLGGKRNSSELEQQIGLPLTLVIALLKDLNGNIDLNLPVEGRMNEPGFRWEGTILRAIRDVLIGAVTSPLKLLGAIFRGKEELEDFTFKPLQFVPGSNQLTDKAKIQLGRVSQFLAQRPELDLRLSGMAGPEDLQRLKDQAILTQLASATVPAPEQPGNTIEATAGPPSPVTPQEEIRRFLTQQLYPIDHASPVSLSESATTLLGQLRQKTAVAPETVERLVEERVQKVTTELTTQHAVAATRIHVHPEKQRGAGAAEVRYVIQTREGETAEEQEKPPQEKKEQRKRENR